MLYLGVCFVLTGMVNYSDLSEGAPISDAFDQVGLGWASVLINIAAIAGLSSVILVDIVAMGRIGFALCRDGLLPPAVGQGARALPHARSGSPIGDHGGRVPCSGPSSRSTTLAEMVSIGTLFAFLVVAIAVVVLRRTKPKMKRPFRTPVGAVAADRLGRDLPGADGQPGRRDLAAVPGLAGRSAWSSTSCTAAPTPGWLRAGPERTSTDELGESEVV